MASPASAHSFRAGVAAALVICALGGLAIVSGLGVSSGVRQQIGPQFMPTLAGLGLLAAGLILLVRALNGAWTCEARAADAVPPFSGRALAWVIGGLMVNVLAIGFAGFAAASVVLFLAVARASGSRAWRRDLLCAVVLVVLLELLFGRILGLRLGSGPLDLLLSEWQPR